MKFILKLHLNPSKIHKLWYSSMYSYFFCPLKRFHEFLSRPTYNPTTILGHQLTIDNLRVYASKKTLVVTGGNRRSLHEQLESRQRFDCLIGGMQIMESGVELEVEIGGFRVVVFQHLRIAQVKSSLREKWHIETTPKSFFYQKLTHILSLHISWTLLKNHKESLTHSTFYHK